MGESCNDQQTYFNRYQLIRLLAKGGMGEVYEAFDNSLGRKIALKRVRSDLAGQTHMKNRFLGERTILAGLSHPSIIPIFEVGEENGIPYYTMPLVTGSNFKEVIRVHHQSCRTLESVRKLLKFFLKVCHGISYVHQAGILHRDIKAENIMLSSSGQVIIIDWGLARPFQRKHDEQKICLNDCLDRRMPSLGRCPGTLNYIAPERFFQQETEQSDLYSLGVLFYFILAGHLPFSRKGVRDFKKRWKTEAWEDPRKSISEFEMPDILMRILEKSLAREPSSRYGSVQDLIDNLNVFFAGTASSPSLQELDIGNFIDWKVYHEKLSLSGFDTRLNGEVAHGFLAKPLLKTSSRLEIELKREKSAIGFGVSFDLLEPMKKENDLFFTGCFLWVSFQDDIPSFLYYRKTILFEIPDLGGSFSEYIVNLTIELEDRDIHFSIGSGERKTYPKIFPSMGARFGFVYNTALISIKRCKIYSNDLMLKQCCLKVPDSLLRSGAQEEALEEYRRIWWALAGYDEAREAYFRSGVILLGRYEHTRNASIKEQETHLSQQIWETFNALRGHDFLLKHWIGKALFYRFSGDFFEEVNCLEFSYHLLKSEEDQFVFKCFCMARTTQILSEEDERVRARFLLMIARNFPEQLNRKDFQEALSALRAGSLRPPFFDPAPWESISQEELHFRRTVELACILEDPVSLSVLLESYLKKDFISPEGIFHAIYGLIALGELDVSRKIVQELDCDLTKKKFNSFLLKRILSLYTYFVCHDLEGFVTFFANDPFMMNCSVVLFHFNRLFAIFLMTRCLSKFQLPSSLFFFEFDWSRIELLQQIFNNCLLAYKQVLHKTPSLFLRVCELTRRFNPDFSKECMSLFSSSSCLKDAVFQPLNSISDSDAIQAWNLEIISRYIDLFEFLSSEEFISPSSSRAQSVPSFRPVTKRMTRCF
ncbi:protein kinase domain-containing protein [Candidatus Similichlamydia epinepheli]|uniref:protein kinase domain-containing protein n=1 Tax=Candidatus Similichlamydia epinepheli TaxID=1903953 RepID=UPI000D368D84|nr:protein kinase [Candidatus Similichlamydia epinepheli]